MVARLAAANMSVTITRRSAVSQPVHDGHGGPAGDRSNSTVGGSTAHSGLLKPISLHQHEDGLEWYFAKHSLLSATAFYMDLRNYVSYGK